MKRPSSAGLLLLSASIFAGCGDDTSTGGGGSGGGVGATGGGGASAECGNGVVDAGEACDSGDLQGETCETQGFASGALGCSASCELDTSGCSEPTCGDGAAEGREDCDGEDLLGATCEAEGFPGGVLGCSATCAFDTTQCEAEVECGNDVAEGDEACDGTDLGTASCSSLGFFGGRLGCDGTCAFDTSACTNCGDDTVDLDEECDGTDLGQASCTSLGFDIGVLDCASDCTFDTADCDFLTCGNGSIDGGEECDGALLGGETCLTLAFDGGTLDCAGNCVFDTSACTTCGDGLVEGAEACDGVDLDGQTCELLGFASGSLACSASCAFDTSSCSTVPAPATGEVVITEIMQNPSGADATIGEWFELFNPSNATTYQLGGCVVEGDMPTESFTILGDVQIPPQGRLTFASVAAPGFTPNYVYSGFTLTNGADGVRVLCGGTLVDEVLYDGGPTFPDPDGASMNLSEGLDAGANDSGANWCPSTVATANFTTGDLGSPGQPNEDCPGALTIDFCRLQFPLSITAAEGSSAMVYGRLYIAGLTDQTTGNDPAPNVLGAVGYGADGSDPSQGGWTWTAAVPNPGWDGSSFGEPNNDEYQASLVLPPASGSPYDFAYRFSGDGGLTWTYCDGDAGGSTTGYSAANAGQLTSQPGAGPANIWINELHYGDAGADADEGVEIAGPAGTDLAGYSIVLYNGAGGASYLTAPLTGSLPNQSNGFGTLWFAIAGVQNGAPDGLALVSPANQVVQFLCYEGSFSATNGAAMGQTCVDIGVDEEPEPADGMSLQLIGTGGNYAAFTWTGPTAHSRGAVNTGQVLQ